MSLLPTTTSLDYPKTRAEPCDVVKEPKSRLDYQPKPQRVTEAEYWEKYYDNPDVIYEWNNGLLEEKPVSDYENVLMYLWFLELLRHFLKTHPIASITALELGFRLNLPPHCSIRRPDLSVILNNNPVPLQLSDRSYQGICDICIEVLSDSKPEEIERDTVTKFWEYEAAGVKEYYILYSKGEPMAFYRLNRQGVYVPIKRVQDDLIQSTVLPGFQFRVSDLFNQPSEKQMAFDPVYDKFVLPYYQEEKRKAQEEKRKAEAEKRARQKAERLAKKEAQRAAAAEAENARLKALLASKEK
jgi:Uma2 family endonuclease